jgi:hypothetical protein
VPVEGVVAVRRSKSLPTMSKLARRLGWAAALAATVMVGVPLAASASPYGATPQARSAAVAGAVYGGITPQTFPVVIELNKSRRQVVRAAIAVRMPCTSGAVAVYPDSYVKLTVSKKGKFSASFGPTVNRNDDGTTTDFEGSMSGKANAARTQLSGKWQLKITQHDVSGAVTDTCDSGTVSWKAKQ